MSHGFELEVKSVRIKLSATHCRVFDRVTNAVVTDEVFNPPKNIGPRITQEQRFFDEALHAIPQAQRAHVDAYGFPLFAILENAQLPKIEIKIDHSVDPELIGGTTLIPEIVVNPMENAFYNSPNFNVLLSEISLIINTFEEIRTVIKSLVSEEMFVDFYNRKRLAALPGARPMVLHALDVPIAIGDSHICTLNYNVFLQNHEAPNYGIAPQITFSCPVGNLFNSRQYLLALYDVEQARAVNITERRLFDQASRIPAVFNGQDNFNKGIIVFLRFMILVTFFGENFEGTRKNIFHLFPKTSIYDVIVYWLTPPNFKISLMNLLNNYTFVTSVFSDVEKNSLMSEARIRVLLAEYGDDFRFAEYVGALNTITAGALQNITLQFVYICYLKKIYEESARTPRGVECATLRTNINRYFREALGVTEAQVARLETEFGVGLFYFFYESSSRLAVDAPGGGVGQPKFELRSLKNYQSTGQLKRALVLYSSHISKIQSIAGDPRVAADNILRRKADKTIIPAEFRDYRVYLTQIGVLSFNHPEIAQAHGYFVDDVCGMLLAKLGETWTPNVTWLEDQLKSGGLFRFEDVMNKILEMDTRPDAEKTLTRAYLDNLISTLRMVCKDFEYKLGKFSRVIPDFAAPHIEPGTYFPGPVDVDFREYTRKIGIIPDERLRAHRDRLRDNYRTYLGDLSARLVEALRPNGQDWTASIEWVFERIRTQFLFQPPHMIPHFAKAGFPMDTINPLLAEFFTTNGYALIERAQLLARSYLVYIVNRAINMDAFLTTRGAVPGAGRHRYQTLVDNLYEEFLNRVMEIYTTKQTEYNARPGVDVVDYAAHNTWLRDTLNAFRIYKAADIKTLGQEAHFNEFIINQAESFIKKLSHDFERALFKLCKNAPRLPAVPVGR